MSTAFLAVFLLACGGQTATGRQFASTRAMVLRLQEIARNLNPATNT